MTPLMSPGHISSLSRLEYGAWKMEDVRETHFTKILFQVICINKTYLLFSVSSTLKSSYLLGHRKQTNNELPYKYL